MAASRLDRSSHWHPIRRCARSPWSPTASSNLRDVPPPPPPAAGEVQIRVKAVALNHIDVWGWRGMAFAKRKMPLVVGAEAAGEIAAVGPDVDRVQARAIRS